ncbi:ROK family protein [Enemella evansiae]|uniref:ROK family protein n=1 Tax=Enemella evansiae TaxID=2016499 RepID=UPI001E4CD8A1|nr:ROK family protein [Enemella evansiae]
MVETLALDIGGTKIALAIIDESGDIRREVLRPTVPGGAAEELFAQIADGLGELVDGWGATDEVLVGIGSAGPINEPKGTISPINIPGWRDFPVADRVRQVVTDLLDRPVRVGLAGDGHCIALGEHWLGAARDVDSMVGMIVSTGVGGGAVLDGRLFRGDTGNAVHVGHTSVNFLGAQCDCGSRGCVEMYARGPAMVAYARQLGWTGGDDARKLAMDAAEGDEAAEAAIDRGMRALAAGIAALSAELDVRVFVIGGGVSKAGEVIFDPLRAHLADFTGTLFVPEIDLRRAELENAGLLGAAAVGLALRGLGPLRG